MAKTKAAPLNRLVIICTPDIAVRIAKANQFPDADLVVVPEESFDKAVEAITPALPPGKRITVYRFKPKKRKVAKKRRSTRKTK